MDDQLSNEIYQAVQAKWRYIARHMDNDDYQFRVIAAYVVTESKNFDLRPVVVSIGTGTKLIEGGKRISENKLIDSHAEVIARRGFKRFLFSEIKKGIGSQFVSRTNDNQKYRWKFNKKVHLYVSYPPCGMAKRDPKSDNYKALRVIETGSQAETPVLSSITRKAGQSYTCSDKIALFNACKGIQGALLSTFLEPIFLESVIVNVTNPTGIIPTKANLEMALYGRIGARELKIITRTQTQDALFSSFNESANERSEESTLTHNWVFEEEVELTDSFTGCLHQRNNPSLPHDNTSIMPSRLCKSNFLKDYKEIVRQLVTDGVKQLYYLPNENLAGLSADSVSYKDLKAKAKEYKQAKEKAKATFQQKKLGVWCSRG